MTIQETTFGPKTYLALKKSISTDQISDKQMYDEAGIKLGAYIEAKDLKIVGPWTVLYFTWDQENKTTDIAIAFPVAEIGEVNDIELSIVEVPELKAAKETLSGSYEGLPAVHESLMAYSNEHGHNEKVENSPVIAAEEYVVNAMQDPNPENWKTEVYYFHN